MPVTLSGYRVKAPINVSGRHNGVNVGILVSRLRDLGSRPGQFIVMCSWAKKFAGGGEEKKGGKNLVMD